MASVIHTPTVGRRAAAATLRAAAAAAAIALTVSVAATGPARADDLDNQKANLDQQAQQVRSSLEFLEGRIAQTASDLANYRAQLPGAQQALLEAQGRVAAATKEAEALAVRVDAAQQDKAEITEQLNEDRGKAQETKKLIGQIASQAYESGGVPPDLSLLFGNSGSGSLPGSIDLTNQAIRTQNAELERLNQQTAANVNLEARLEAVEEQIRDLKAEADAALAREQAARDDAAAKKAAIDNLVADTERLNQELEAQRPTIQKQIADVRAQQDTVAVQIGDRDRRLREQWLAEQAARNQSTQIGSPSAFGLRHPFAYDIPITSGFGWRPTPPGTIDFFGTGGYMHTGIDFGAPCGTPVYAAAAGTVTVGGWTTGGGGWTVMISHGVIQGNAMTTVYYHNSSVVVSPGQSVAQGQLIAYSGSTGNSTGCHAHFETWLNGSPVDPMTLL
ncbi:peptidoglycan DD-metalloendopeptidase family protein [Sinomonas sp. JGH33]|uniref:Peptidoglycan DD-metalloendopeptidase family protein n=1 Tax=Sinomonas terricola TaxID=3110330 RepID=A0ABU5T5G9_9MICC|nr:peptidoglycan DD-metalloendopeptidase family protein [Sinomonas sp. JGH33]MEA5454912.1 peptidoglycan DD-metalloendopeptidase family protein [Sinomonas sp. JGH33]